MRFATGLPGVNLYPPVSQPWESSMGAEDYQLVARTADEVGFDCLSVPEHIVVPDEMVELMGATWSHALTVMAFVAGATRRIEVDSAVIVLPYHHPVVLAKAIATLDVLSGGRARVTIGVGHAEREFEVLGVPFRERGRVADEYLAAMVELWTSENPSFRGRYVAFDDIAFEPKPKRSPHPPIIVGGNSDAALRRAARHDGWFPWLVGPDELPARLARLREQPAFAERTRPFEVVVPLAPPEVDESHRPLDGGGGRPRFHRSAQEVVDAVGRLQELGVTQTMVPLPPARSLTEHLEGLHWVAEEVIPAFR
ncbi:MAG TPA: TIGR03619 family F420-dependent LLM class oxidoreductase [Acidimicrobiales bacterium]